MVATTEIAGRVCAKCRLWKPATELYKHPTQKTGFASYCRPCNKARLKKAYLADIHRHRRRKLQRRLEYIKRHPDRVAANTVRQNLRRAAHRVGIEPEVIPAMIAAQGGLCAICKRPEDGRRLSLDHNHRTGKMRGLLCGECNLALGKFGDDVTRLASAIAYLEAHR
jgi:hypothetical protein